MLAEVGYFAEIAARQQWDAEAVDLAPDAAAWAALPAARRARLTTLLAGFRVAEDAVAVHIEPFEGATQDRASARVLALQRRDEVRHARFFDRVAAEVLGVVGETPGDRCRAARTLAPAAVVDLFERRLPELAGALAAGRADLADGVGLYHLLLEGVVFSCGQRALLDELGAGGLPGLLDGVERVERDERWHVGFGLRCLADAAPDAATIHALLADADAASRAWGPVVDEPARLRALRLFGRRLGVAGLLGVAATG